jgi:hypothetical protein
MLTGFFAANCSYVFVHQYTYQEFPQHFVWHKDDKEWRPRERRFAIGRLYFIAPTAGERFYLRMLLINIAGPTSWQHLRTFDSVERPSFYDACLARGLLQNDNKWQQCLEEASMICMGDTLHRLFAMIMRHCEPSVPETLWEEFKHHLCDDICHHLRALNILHPSNADVYDYGLFLLNKHLCNLGSSLSDFVNMPHIHSNWDHIDENHFLLEQLAYNCANKLNLANDLYPQLNDNQLLAFQSIFESVDHAMGRTFFLNSPAGTGKMFVYRALCHHLRADGHIILCVALSGIAVLLLPGGRTAHSTFSIPVNSLCEDSVCSINKNSKQAVMLRHVSLIIWDEAAMQHRCIPSIFIIPHLISMSFPATSLKQLIDHFMTFSRQTLLLVVLPLFLAVTFNKHFQSWYMVHKRTLSLQLFSAPSCGRTSLSCILLSTCV